DPKQEYKRESFSMFNNMLYNFKKEVLVTLSKVDGKKIKNNNKITIF
ncbi:hypothetical protein, partial [Enterobacteriaceae endosymbiont of Donacia piscatrix]